MVCRRGINENNIDAKESFLIFTDGKI